MSAADNPLVATPVEDGPAPWAGIWIAEDIEQIVLGVRSGSWIDGTLGVVGAGLDGLALVSDPAGALLQYGIAWLIEHVRPLSEALDWLAGDPAQIAAHAQTWRNVAASVRDEAEELLRSVRWDVEEWTGAAGDAYRAHADFGARRPQTLDRDEYAALSEIAGPEDPMAMEIDAVERPVALLPGVRVAALPEVIREHRMATPVLEDLQSWLGGEALIPEPGGVLWKALDRLAVWEAFTVRMNSGWPPDGWYPAEYLREDLANRDELAGAAAEVPGEVAGRFGAALERVDAAFRDGTREDPDAPADAVWWRRRVVGLGRGPQGAEEGA